MIDKETREEWREGLTHRPPRINPALEVALTLDALLGMINKFEDVLNDVQEIICGTECPSVKRSESKWEHSLICDRLKEATGKRGKWDD